MYGVLGVHEVLLASMSLILARLLAIIIAEDRDCSV